MSNTTAAFDAAWAKPGRTGVTLLVVEFVDADGIPVGALRFSHQNIFVNGLLYAGLIEDVGAVSAPGSLMANDVSLASCTITLLLEGMDPAWRTYMWQGATASVTLWETSTDPTDDLAFPLKNGVIEQAEFEHNRVTLQIRQRSNWNRPVASRIATRDEYPLLPEASVGAIIPTRLGAAPMSRLLRPWANPYDNRIAGQSVVGIKELSKCAPLTAVKPSGTARAVLVDSGRGPFTNSAKVVVAGHKLSNLNDLSNGFALFAEQKGNGLASVMLDPGDIFNTDTEAGFYFRDSATTAVGGTLVRVLRPTAVGLVLSGLTKPTGSIVPDCRPLLDPENFASFALLDAIAGKTIIPLTFESPQFSDFGEPVEAAVSVWHDLGTDSGLLVACNLWNGIPVTVNNLGYVAPGASPVCQVFGLGMTTWPSSLSAQLTIADYTGIAPDTGKCRIYAVTLLLRYIPKMEQIAEGKMVEVTKTRPVRYEHGDRDSHGSSTATYRTTVMSPPTTELVTKFFANVGGKPDTPASRYAGGAASGTVKRPTDVMHQVLGEFGGEGLGSVTTGVGLFGSFTDARASMVSATKREMSVGLSVTDDSDVGSVLATLMSASCSWCYLSPWDDHWRVVPVKVGMPVSWPRKVSKLDLISSPRFRTTPNSRLVSGVRMPYANDEFTGTFKSEVNITERSSSAGREYFAIRHESLDVVLNTNDTLDLRRAGVVGQLVLSPAEHTHGSLCGSLRRLNSTSFHGIKWGFGFGGIATSGCYKVVYIVGATTYVFSVPFGTYDMETMASMWQQNLAANAISGITVTYSRTTRKFSVACNAGVSITLDFFNNTHKDDNACALYGFAPTTHGSGAGGTLVSDFTVEEGVFALSASGGFDWLRHSGPYGFSSAAPRCAAQVLGFEVGADLLATSGGATWYTGFCPKGTRERTLRSMTARLLGRTGNGPSRRPTTVDGRAVHDADTAKETVGRVVDLFGRATGELSFAAEGLIGIDRGMVLEFDADMDTLMPYPDPDSDGSWVGKRFFVTETEQRLGPSTYDTAIVAVSI